jgi:transcriptional regulator
MDAAQFSRMVDAIVGFEIDVSGWRPTVKLSQNKPLDEQHRVRSALATRGHGALARLMEHIAGESGS